MTDRVVESRHDRPVIAVRHIHVPRRRALELREHRDPVEHLVGLSDRKRLPKDGQLVTNGRGRHALLLGTIEQVLPEVAPGDRERLPRRGEEPFKVLTSTLHPLETVPTFHAIVLFQRVEQLLDGESGRGADGLTLIELRELRPQELLRLLSVSGFGRETVVLPDVVIEAAPPDSPSLVETPRM